MIKKCLIIWLFILISPVIHAFEVGHGDNWHWSISGFGTLGGAYSFDHNAGFLRDIKQPHGVTGFSYDLDSGLGLQTNFKWHDIEFVAQGVSRYRYDNTYKPELTMAFVKFDPIDNLTVRGGRLLTDVFMSSESRNIGYSYVTMRPPVEFLGEMFLNYFDGADFVYKLPMDKNLLNFKAYAGHVSEKVAIISALGVYDQFNAICLIYGFQLDFQHEDWKAKLGFSELRIHDDFPGVKRNFLSVLSQFPVSEARQIEQDVITKDRWLQYYSLAVSWSPSPFNADLGIAVIDSPQAKILTPRLNGFLTLSYHIDDFTPFVSFASSVPIGRNQYATLPTFLPNAVRINQSIDYLKNVSEFNRRTVSLGLRYDITENIDTKFQVDFSHGSTNNLLWESVSNRSFDGNTVVFGATLDFVF